MLICAVIPGPSPALPEAVPVVPYGVAIPEGTTTRALNGLARDAVSAAPGIAAAPGVGGVSAAGGGSGFGAGPIGGVVGEFMNRSGQERARREAELEEESLLRERRRQQREALARQRTLLQERIASQRYEAVGASAAVLRGNAYGRRDASHYAADISTLSERSGLGGSRVAGGRSEGEYYSALAAGAEVSPAAEAAESGKLTNDIAAAMRRMKEFRDYLSNSQA